MERNSSMEKVVLGGMFTGRRGVSLLAATHGLKGEHYFTL
jgi:hypothetical protein